MLCVEFTLSTEHKCILAFHEELLELLQNMTEENVHSTLNEENATSDCATHWCMRVLFDSSSSQGGVGSFCKLSGGVSPDIPSFCSKKRKMEPMGKEYSMVQFWP